MKTIDINNKEQINEILDQSRVCYLAMSDEGMPYVVPFNFGYDENYVYLHSGPEGRKMDIIKKNNRVCLLFSIDGDLIWQNENVACSYSMESKSLMIQGRVDFIEDIPEKTEAMNIIMKKYTQREFDYSDPAIKNVKIWRIPLKDTAAREFGVSVRKRKLSRM